MRRNVQPGGSASRRSRPIHSATARSVKSVSQFLILLAPLSLIACATAPTGPGVMVLPGTGKSFDEFRVNDVECRQFASVQIGGKTPNQTGSDSGIKSAAVGTVIGAAAGAVIGGGQGAAVGAGVGLAGGALAGTAAADHSSYNSQRRYDIAYTQCMYAKGHKVPVSGRFESATSPPPSASTPPPGTPPPGTPPPPPPGAPPPPPGTPPPPPPGAPPPPPPR